VGDNAPEEYRMVIHADRRPSSEHARRYNGPSASEVAALIPGSEDGEVGRRDIVLRRRGQVNSNGNEVLDSVNIGHRSYDPLSYVLINPYGRDGWHMELRISEETSGRRNKLSPLMFYAYQLFPRTNEYSLLLRAERLFQQYVVDQFCKVESERLSFIRHNQSKLRAEDYTTLRDLLGDSGMLEDEHDMVRSGRLFVLPSTHVGGDRYMRQNLQDIIAMSNTFGHPDIFLTMTCNPKWPEITRALLPGQTAVDRPDLSTRVFRSLPHVHCLFFLDRDGKNALLNTENVDEIISAEIPSAEDDPVLRDLVLKHQIHNPCGNINPDAVCMHADGCTKKFPKMFNDETGQNDNELYMTYKRRRPEEGGETAEYTMRVRGRSMTVQLDNSWVVPYNPELTKLFACHLNVELCISRVGGIKYLFKYICKGHDRVTAELMSANGRYDEISNFQDMRYVSTTEGLWRLLQFDIVVRHPTVVRLDVHLPGRHTVYYQEQDAAQVLERDRAGTKLTEWFLANQLYPGGREIRYVDFPKYFTWNKPTKKWTPRARYRQRDATDSENRYDFSRPAENVVSRIYTVSPREGERYFIRTLLFHQSGCKSFEELRTVNGEVCESFREACLRKGLLVDDDEWKRVIHDNFSSSFVPLTEVFVTILLHCNPSDPRALWTEHKTQFVTDIRNRYRGNPEAQSLLRTDDSALNYALLEIQDYLTQKSHRSLECFPLPDAHTDVPPLPQNRNRDPAVRRDEEVQELHERSESALNSLNADQRAVFDQIIATVLPGTSSSNRDGASSSTAPPPAPPSDRMFFLDAPGGTGKTFLTNCIRDFAISKGKDVLMVASSAVAAGLMNGGSTAHSALKMILSSGTRSSWLTGTQSRLSIGPCKT